MTTLDLKKFQKNFHSAYFLKISIMVPLDGSNPFIPVTHPLFSITIIVQLLISLYRKGPFMKRKTATLFILLAGALIAGAFVGGNRHAFTAASMRAIIATAPEQGDTIAWKKVDSLVDQGLTESALKAVDSLFVKYKKTNNATQIVKTLMYRMRLESYKEEASIVKAIALLEVETAVAKGALRAILHSITAEVYWRYYQQNRWRFYDRTRTVDFKQDDITTWDLSQIISTTLHHYDQSLADQALLKKAKLVSYSDILLESRASEKRRPTLFDFLAHRAIDVFMNAEVDLVQPAYVFQLDRAEYSGRFTEFASMRLATRDSLSFKFRALKILQDLIAFHANDGEFDALVDADLKRLDFVREHSTVETKDSLYLRSLEYLEERCGSKAIAAEVSHAIAQWYADKGRSYQPGTQDQYKWYNKKAVDICRAAIKKHPESYGACLCESLKDEIVAKFISIEVEEVVFPYKPFRMLCSWKNMMQMWFRAIPMNEEEYRKLREKYPYDEQDKLIKDLRSMSAAAEWNTPIPDDGDFQTHCAEVKSPALASGHYVLIASANADFTYPKNGIALNTVWVSRLSYFGRSNKGDYELYVKDRETGLPLEKATVKKIERFYDKAKREYSTAVRATVTTDNEGRAVFPSSVKSKSSYSNPFRMEIIHNNDRLMSDREQYQYTRSERTSSTVQTFFFTDRSIYRPGQTVYFKGIVLKRKGDSSSIMANHKTKVEFRDANYNKVAELPLVTNEFGTINGQFTTPTGVLNGQMSIQDKGGSVYFSVEEYKRPKFEVLPDPVKGSFRLGELVTVTGQAKAFAGSFIDGAQVKYRVVRSTSYPRWHYWWSFWYPPSPEMEVMNGSTVTNDTGSFSLKFTAIPDRSVAKRYNPTFTYMVFVDVTDISGETRSAQTGVSVGYTALDLSVAIGQQVEKGKDSAFAIVATNTSGVTVPVKGTIAVFLLSSPNVPLRTRLWRKPDIFIMNKREYNHFFPGLPFSNEDRIDTWPREKEVYRKPFDTKTDSLLTLAEMKGWQQGVYAVESSAKDAFGQEVVTTQYFTLFSRDESAPPYPLCDWFTVVKGSGEPGEKAAFLIGSGEKDVSVLFEVEHKNKIAVKEWLTLSKTQKLITVPIEEKHRGNFSVHFTWIKNGRNYRHDEQIVVPWTNKELTFSFESFRNKLLPGQKEEWKIIIGGHKKDKMAAEMVAAMYDASLDAFKPHGWYFNINPSFGSSMAWDMSGQFGEKAAELLSDEWNQSSSCSSITYPSLNWYGLDNWGYYGGYGGGMRRVSRMLHAADAPAFAEPEEAMPAPVAPKAMMKEAAAKPTSSIAPVRPEPLAKQDAQPSDEKKKEESTASDKLAQIKARANLNETAFFFPKLMTNEKGEVILSFTMPEALTRWKMLGFAHTKDLKFGSLTKELVTQKPLMVMPNLPRFLREGDRITLSGKVSNLSDSSIAGFAQCMLFDATTMKPVDTVMGNLESIKKIAMSKGLSTPVTWEIKVPDGIPAVLVRIVAKAGDFSDGEESTLPLLTNRMLVTESMPLPMRGKGEKKFNFEKLISLSGGSSTLRHHRLTLEYTQNPAWYAVQALPYLMEFPHECAEQMFARYYANTMAAHIANSSPKIKAVFDSWKSQAPDALLSNLEKNQELKSAILEETPWVMDGNNESERKKRIGLLFDLNKLADERSTAHRTLVKMQLSNGGWPWFAGMPDDRYITQYIVTGFGRLRHLKMIDLSKDGGLKTMVEKAVGYTDDRIREDYEWIMKHADNPDSNHLGSLQIQYLYARTFFKDITVAGRNKKAYDYYKTQAARYWLRNNRYLQGMVALALYRMGVEKVPADIIRSLKENSLSSEEMGMYWKEMYEGYYWYEAPIETQALYIEAFDEVVHDTASVEAMKVWLLKSKQTQNWSTTRATAEACYALLLRGTDLLTSGGEVTVKLGTLLVDPKKLKDAAVEAGTGYFKTSWSGGEIKSDMGAVTVSKGQPGVAWGALYWQYFEQLDKITAAATPLKLSKKLFVKMTSDRGPVLEPVTGKTSLKVGDRITVRIELRSDRDLEYVHMKDLRAAGFEPTNVLSGFRWQDGLGYYESTRDVATHFFFGSLKKGTYVFEYDLVVNHKGDFSNGITSIQCMYAPEFSSHSEGIRVKVGE
jgi:hypothetical protein